MNHWVLTLSIFWGTLIYLLYKFKTNNKIQDYILSIVLKSKLLTNFYINYLIRDPYWKDEIQLRNHLNQRVRGSVIGYETTIMFEVCWKYIRPGLGKVPFEADIVIAGLSVYGRAYEDSRYYPEPLSYYPYKSIGEIFEICYGDNAPEQVSGDDVLLEIIKTIGHHALIEKDLEFDGIISRFCMREFDDRDWRDFTDRFIKYGF